MESASKYLTDVITTLSTGNAREHSYRPAFKSFIENLNSEIRAQNEPARSEYGAPDFVFSNKNLIIGYAETKDINIDLDKVEKSEQLKRYFGYSNLILTNYLEFRFFRNGERYCDPISVGIFNGGIIVPKQENAELLERTIKDFLNSKPEKIKSGVRLAKIMGGKARRIRENVLRYVSEKTENNQELRIVHNVIKKLLVHDMTPEQFADMYAQTLVYGLFVARYHDKTPETFSRAEARDLIPASNPLLRHFFDHIAGADFDKRLSIITNELCEIFSVADVRKIMEEYYSRTDLWGETKESPDPVIHFYEDFLKEYDNEQRVKLGAFYTPLPVVRFIVRSVDSVLKSKFNLLSGLADTSKIEIVKKIQGQKCKEMVHKVQILDPATGTGTFLNEVIRQIHKAFEGQEGRWPSYVDFDLLPRLYGFELMMAPYTIAHLKIGMMLRDMGYDNFSRRLGVYLTNSLEEGFKSEGTLFESFGFTHSLTEEAIEASKIKNEKPIMIVLGNPPYSISSSNKGKWILDLIKDYKKDLNERKINLDDDYIKFIRFAEHFIEKNEKGIVAMITNNSFIDGITHRQMRKHLLETFDEIYILDLHGNARKGETDQNVFDIQQGVSIGIFVRNTKNKSKLGKVYYSEILGNRKEKYEKLNKNSMETVEWKKLDYKEPYYFFVPKDLKLKENHLSNFGLNEIFNVFSAGIKTKIDKIATDFNINILQFRINEILENKMSLSEIIKKYAINEKTTWEYDKAIRAIYNEDKFKLFAYRPFDYRYVFFDHNFLSRSRKKVMDNLIKNNLALSFVHQGKNQGPEALITKEVTCEDFITNHTFTAPLYIFNNNETISNLKKEIFEEIKSKVKAEIKPEDVLDYIYAILHSPNYREKYKEFLKIDFPRVPYPKDNETFWKLVEKGKELRELHLMESSRLNKFITTFSESGSNVIEKIKYEDGKVFINAAQYFGEVPEVAWNFYIGGYQPAQKWLKDRKGRTLSNEDLEHYQKIIVALCETDKIMKEIDRIMDF